MEDDLFVITGGKTGDEMLYYENDRNKISFGVSQSLFKYNESIEIYHNLCDCHIDICAPTVLTLFEDNFDYEYIRKQFFGGILNSEIYNYRVYMDIIEQEYATRIVDWRTYHGICKDIIERWTFPLVLDNNSVGLSYLYNRGNIYKEKDVRIGRNVQIVNNTVLGYKVEIGNKCKISNCVIGEMTRIGEKCLIKNCYIFGNCIIGNNCCIQGAIIADNCVIGDNCNVGKGCILSYGVKLDNNIELAHYTKLTLLDKSHWVCDDEWGDLNHLNMNTTSDQDSHSHSQTISVGGGSSSSIGTSAYTSAATGKITATALDVLQGSQTQSNSISESMVTHAPNKDNTNGNGVGSGAGATTKWDIKVVGSKGHGFLFTYSLEDDYYIPDEANHILLEPNDVPPRGIDFKTHFCHEEEKASSEDGTDNKDNDNSNNMNKNNNGINGAGGGSGGTSGIINGRSPLVDLFGTGIDENDTNNGTGGHATPRNNRNNSGNKPYSQSQSGSASASLLNTETNTDATITGEDTGQYLMIIPRTILNRLQFERLLSDVTDAVNNAENNESDFANVIVEMTSLKLSHHAQLSDLVACVLIGLFIRVQRFNLSTTNRTTKTNRTGGKTDGSSSETSDASDASDGGNISDEIEQIRQTVRKISITQGNSDAAAAKEEELKRAKEIKQKKVLLLAEMAYRWCKLFRKFVQQDKNNEKKNKRHEMDIIEGLEIAARWHKDFLEWFKFVLMKFIESDLIDNLTVVEWYEFRMKNKQLNDNYIQEFVDSMQRYIPMLKDDDDSDESDDDDDDSDESDDDDDEEDDDEDDSEDLDSDAADQDD